MESAPLDEGQWEKSLFYTFRPDNPEVLRRWVQEAFAEAIYPGDGDGDIVVSGCPGCCAECGETHEFFRGKHWREIAESHQPLQNFGWGGLALLTPQAWRFYLPAYLLVSLQGGNEAENALDCALSALTPWPPEGLNKLGGGVIDYVKLSADWFQARALHFSVAQTECIAAYLCAVSESAPEDNNYLALATYWKERAAEARLERSVV